jgi:hypothetical protein
LNQNDAGDHVAVLHRALAETRHSTFHGHWRRRLSKATRGASAALLIAIAVIHAASFSGHLQEATWLGVLFIALIAGCLVAAAALLRGLRVAWLLALASALAPLVGYLLITSVGIGGIRESFAQPLGPLSVAIEAALVPIVCLGAMVDFRD